MDGLRQRQPRSSSGGATNANGYTAGYGRLHDEEDKKPSLLGFRHWLFAIAVIGVVYAGVVFFHLRLPAVKPAGDYSAFSEARARALLKQITALGPRPSGSQALEKHAMSLLQRRLESAAGAADVIGKNRVEIDTQRPTGCFDLKFLSAFTLCYQNVTNKIARIGPAKGPAAHSLLLNCHIDTMPDTPGATDDAVSCTIMLDILDVLAREDKELQYDVVFLFNGAEENFLQGAHGFIENHPWRHTIRAFINLEGTGSGGREILFQAGPGNSWLLQAYLDAAPHPYCSILAQEVFQSGIIPSDTDFRIFRDFGRVSGLDIAYTRNGWVYHTEFDTEDRIDAGSIQRAGDNVLAVVRKVISEDDLAKPGKAAEQNKWVFYDVVGLFTVRYTVELGVLLNVGTSALTIFFTLMRIRKGTYGGSDLLIVFFRHVLSLLAMAVVGGAIAVVVNLMDLTMCWYSLPELIGGLYVLPMVTAGLYVHELFHAKQYMRNAEMAHFDSVMLLLAAALLWMTHAGLASAFFLLNYLLFAMLRDPMLFAMGRVGLIKTVTPRWVLAVQMLSLVPAMIFAAYAISQCVDFFVPVIGRLGMAINPEAIMAPLALVIAFTFVLFTNNIVYISRNPGLLALECIRQKPGTREITAEQKAIAEIASKKLDKACPPIMIFFNPLFNTDYAYAGRSTAGELRYMRDGRQEGGGAVTYELITAAKMNDEKRIELLFTSGYDLNLKDESGWAAIHYASFQGNMKALGALMHCGCDVNITNNSGSSGLHLAIMAIQPFVVELLLLHPKINRTAVDANGCTPFDLGKKKKQNAVGEELGKLLFLLEFLEESPKILVTFPDRSHSMMKMIKRKDTRADELLYEILIQDTMKATEEKAKELMNYFSVWVISRDKGNEKAIQLERNELPARLATVWEEKSGGTCSIEIRRSQFNTIEDERKIRLNKASQTMLVHEIMQYFQEGWLNTSREDAIFMTVHLPPRMGQSISDTIERLPAKLSKLAKNSAVERNKLIREIENEQSKLDSKLSFSEREGKFLAKAMKYPTYGCRAYGCIIDYIMPRSDSCGFLGVNEDGVHVYTFEKDLFCSYSWENFTFVSSPSQEHPGSTVIQFDQFAREVMFTAFVEDSLIAASIVRLCEYFSQRSRGIGR